MHRSIATCMGAAGVAAAVVAAAAGTPLLAFTAGNLANVLYRNHTSFIKDRAPEMGRRVRVSYAVRFH